MARDGQYLEALRAYYGKHRTLPSYAAIGRLVGLSSKGSVAQMVGRLKDGRFLESAPDRRLSPGKRFFERQLGGNVRAGLPSNAADSLIDDFDIDAYLVRDQANTVLVSVKGDSMTGAGIREGDIVVVERCNIASDGQIVVAVVDSEITLKRLGHERGRPVLRPENKDYAVIRPRGEFSIFGVVVGLMRRYR